MVCRVGTQAPRHSSEPLPLPGPTRAALPPTWVNWRGSPWVGTHRSAPRALSTLLSRLSWHPPAPTSGTSQGRLCLAGRPVSCCPCKMVTSLGERCCQRAALHAVRRVQFPARLPGHSVLPTSRPCPKLRSRLGIRASQSGRHSDQDIKTEVFHTSNL